MIRYRFLAFLVCTSSTLPAQAIRDSALVTSDGAQLFLEHGDKVSALVQVCGPMNIPRGDRDLFDASLTWYRSQGDTASINALIRLGPPPWETLQEVITSRQLASVGQAPDLGSMDMNRVMASGGYTAPDSNAMNNALAIVGAMFRELSQVNLEPRLASARTPLLLLVAGKDAIVLPRSLKPGFDAYRGPKEWLEFEASGHLPYVDSTDRFVTAVLSFLRKY